MEFLSGEGGAGLVLVMIGLLMMAVSYVADKRERP